MIDNQKDIEIALKNYIKTKLTYTNGEPVVLFKKDRFKLKGEIVSVGRNTMTINALKDYWLLHYDIKLPNSFRIAQITINKTEKLYDYPLHPSCIKKMN